MKKPIKILTLDTETYNGLIGGLKRIAVFDGLKVEYGYTFYDILGHITKYTMSGYKTYVYIHNLEFDLRKIYNELKEHTIILWDKSLLINGKVAQLVTSDFILQDSLKLLPMSLHTLSHDFGVEHGKLDLWTEVKKRYPGQYKDIVDFLDRCNVDDPLFLEYLGYDVISLYEILNKVMAVSGLDESQLVKCVTTASLSRYIFKNGFKGQQFKSQENNKTDYEIMCSFNWENEPEIEQFFVDGYCGGRCEVFNMLLNENLDLYSDNINKDIYGLHYDVNSLYPYEMEKEYPIGKAEYVKSQSKTKQIFNRWMEEHKGLGFIYCQVYVPKSNIPPLPAKMGKLVFPTGRFFGVWTFTEMEFAINNCGVKIEEYYECVTFSRTYPVFKNFIETMVQIKIDAEKVGNIALRTFAKLLMNTGYGYTGMKRLKSKLDDIKNITNYMPHEIISVNEIYGYIEVENIVKAKYIQVQIAAHVTSFARIDLLKGLILCDKNGTVYYCDTDSIVSDNKLPDDIVDPYRLGAYKLENSIEKAIFLKPKVYVEVVGESIDLNIVDIEKREIILRSSNYICCGDIAYPVRKKFKGITRDTQGLMQYSDYQSLYIDMLEGKKEYEIVERNRTVLRSILYMNKKDLPTEYYETRDKKLNYKTVEKRLMDYRTGKSTAWHFDTVEEFRLFSFSRNTIVEI